jgi:hypothetical protein
MTNIIIQNLLLKGHEKKELEPNGMPIILMSSIGQQRSYGRVNP